MMWWLSHCNIWILTRIMIICYRDISSMQYDPTSESNENLIKKIAPSEPKPKKKKWVQSSCVKSYCIELHYRHLKLHSCCVVDDDISRSFIILWCNSLALDNLAQLLGYFVKVFLYHAGYKFFMHAHHHCCNTGSGSVWSRSLERSGVLWCCDSNVCMARKSKSLYLYQRRWCSALRQAGRTILFWNSS